MAAGWKKQRPMEKRMVTEAERISKEVFLSTRTIETIRQNMKTKIGAKTIAGLIMYAMRNKIID